MEPSGQVGGHGTGLGRRSFIAESGGIIAAGLAMANLATAGRAGAAAGSPWTTEDSSIAFEVPELLKEREESGRTYLRFLNQRGLNMGIYHLKAGAEDRQSPHSQDEVYYVISGSAVINVDDRSHPVKAGTVVYVEARAEHKFVDIKDDLELLVFFAASRGSAA